MKSVWDRTATDELLGRMAHLQHRSRPRWGSLTASKMLAHVTSPLKAAMGELSVAAKPGPLRNPILRYLVIYWMPWPKGAPTAPEFVPADDGDFAARKADFRTTLERFAQRRANRPFADHPAFGDLSEKDWGCLTWRHIDHHLRQFGL